MYSRGRGSCILDSRGWVTFLGVARVWGSCRTLYRFEPNRFKRRKRKLVDDAPFNRSHVNGLSQQMQTKRVGVRGILFVLYKRKGSPTYPSLGATYATWSHQCKPNGPQLVAVLSARNASAVGGLTIRLSICDTPPLTYFRRKI